MPPPIPHFCSPRSCLLYLTGHKLPPQRGGLIPEAAAALAALPLDNWFPGNVFVFDNLNNQVSRTLPPRWWNTEPWLFFTHSQFPSTSCPLSTRATTQATGTMHIKVVLHHAVDERTRQQSNHDHDHPPLNEPGIVPQPAGLGAARTAMLTSATCHEG